MCCPTLALIMCGQIMMKVPFQQQLQVNYKVHLWTEVSAK